MYFNYIYTIYSRIFLLYILLVSGCIINQEICSNVLPSQIYAAAHQKLIHGQYTDAIQDLEWLYNNYSDHISISSIQLDLIYAYYKSTNFSCAKTLINRFLQFHTADEHIDYIFYIRGLINMKLDHDLSKKLFIIHSDNFNPKYAYKAFHDFKQLVHNYPHSQYIANAYENLTYLKNRLAKYELSVIEYYFKRKAYITVIHRTEYMLKHFYHVAPTQQALLYMEQAYQKMQLTYLANQVRKIIIINSKQ